MNRGLTIGEDRTGGLGVRGKGDSALLESTDNIQQVRGLCALQQYHSYTHFLTFTCNQKTHFGTAPIKQWIDDIQWHKKYPGFNDLSTLDQKEVKEAVIQSAAGLVLQV